MLASILNSESAIHAGIFVVRAFVRLRELLAVNVELAPKFKELESKITVHDAEIQTLFEAIRQLMAPLKNRNAALVLTLMNLWLVTRGKSRNLKIMQREFVY